MNLFELRSQSHKPFDGQANAEDTLSKHPYSQTQVFFLLRLMRLLDLQRNHVETDGDWQAKLLDQAIYSTFIDCLEQGVSDDARSLLHQREEAKQG